MVLGAAAGAALPRAACAQAGQRAGVLLELPVGARAAALGGAYSAVADDAEAFFYNPAQAAAPIAGHFRTSASASFGRYLESSSLAGAALTHRVGRGALGAGVRALDYGNEPEVECANPPSCTEGRETGRRVGASDLVATLGYGAGVRRVTVGGAVSLVQQSVAGVSGRTAAFDVGASAEVVEGWTTVALAAQHLGGELRLASQSAALPRTVRLGATQRVSFGGAKVGMLLLGELRAVSGVGGVNPSGGAEVRWYGSNEVNLVGRVGSGARGTEGATRAVAFGGSLLYNRHVRYTGFHGPRSDVNAYVPRLALDYAFQTFERLGPTHRIGVRWWRG